MRDTTTMMAAVVHQHGEPPRFEAFPAPEPAAGEVTVTVRAAGLHPIVKALASGKHYASTGVLPLVPGVDGVGVLEDGTRVYFGFVRPPYGTMAERAVVPRAKCVPLPACDDATVAAIVNPGLSAWLALRVRGELARGDTVLVLGATGAAGQLAVQLAKRLGAGRVLAAGRNPRILEKLPALGADEIIPLGGTAQDLAATIAQRAGDAGIQIIVDYLWGEPTEAAIAAVTRKGAGSRRVRLVEVGESAGATVRLPAAALRSSGLEVRGSGIGSVPFDRMFQEMPAFLELVAEGALKVEVERVPLAEVERAWGRAPNGRRVVLVP